MGARYNWEAICENGHRYGNFSGGPDDCYECGAPPDLMAEGEDARDYLDVLLAFREVREMDEEGEYDR